MIMEICKASTQWLKVLNKCNITLVAYLEMEEVISSLTETDTYLMDTSMRVQA